MGLGGVSMAPRCRVEAGQEEEWDYCTTCRGDSCPDETSVPRWVYKVYHTICILFAGMTEQELM